MINVYRVGTGTPHQETDFIFFSNALEYLHGKKINIVKNSKDADLIYLAHKYVYSQDHQKIIEILEDGKVCVYVDSENELLAASVIPDYILYNEDFLKKINLISCHSNSKLNSAKSYFKYPLWYSHVDWFKKNNFLINYDIVNGYRYYGQNKENSASFIGSNMSSSNPNHANRRIYIDKIREKNFPVKWYSYNNKTPTPKTGKGFIHDKIAAINNHKMHLAFENSLAPGYVTEKIIHGLATDSITLYYGDKSVYSDLNPDSFFMFQNNDELDQALENINDIINSEKKYKEFINQNIFIKENPIEDYLNYLYSITKSI